MAHQFNVLTAETLAATRVITSAEVLESSVFTFDPGGAARDVTLPDPTVANMLGQFVVIVNSADAAEIITIDDTVGDIATPTQNESAWCVCDGVRWRASVGIGT